jgi:hypothetical protein
MMLNFRAVLWMLRKEEILFMRATYKFVQTLSQVLMFTSRSYAFIVLILSTFMICQIVLTATLKRSLNSTPPSTGHNSVPYWICARKKNAVTVPIVMPKCAQKLLNFTPLKK